MAITFLEYLSADRLPLPLLVEGGNVVINGKAANDLDLKKFDRDELTNAIMQGLIAINSSFHDETGLYIWKPSVLKDGKVFSGSTKHFFDSNISTEKFLKHKQSVGDIDVMVDVNLKDRITNFIKNNNNLSFSGLSLVGSKGAGDQLITLWKLQDFDLNVQIDLEFVEYAKDKPTTWSQFSHSSAFADIEIGIKGAFHKLLMTSLLGHKKTETILQLKTKQKEIFAGTHALSIKGMRKKFEKIGVQDGKPLVKLIDSKDFNTNFYDIMKEIFGKDVSEADVELFWSFKGMLKLIKRFLDKHETRKVLNDFVDRLFGEPAQGLYRADPNRDLDEKMVALKYAQEKLGISFDEDKLKRMQTDFYTRYK